VSSLLRDLSKISREGGGGGGIRGRVIFFSAIERAKKRPDTNLKELGGGSQIFQPFARGGSLYFHHSIYNFHPPPPKQYMSPLGLLKVIGQQ